MQTQILQQWKNEPRTKEQEMGEKVKRQVSEEVDVGGGGSRVMEFETT